MSPVREKVNVPFSSHRHPERSEGSRHDTTGSFALRAQDDGVAGCEGKSKRIPFYVPLFCQCERLLPFVLALCFLTSAWANTTLTKITPLKAPGMIQVTIFHTNDIHGHAWPYSEKDNPNIGGLAAIQTIIAKELHRADVFSDEIVLLLDAGDFNTGVPENDILDGKPVLTAMNLMGYHAAALGNHELDKGIAYLKRQETFATFPILSANVYRGKKHFVQPYIIKKIKDLRIALLGLTTHELTSLVDPTKVKDLRVEDPIQTAIKIEKDIQEKSDLLIALTHMGVITDPSTTSLSTHKDDIALAEATSHIDVIVGGHSHTPLHQPLVVRNKLIVQAGSQTQYLGKLVLILNPKKHHEIVRYTYDLIPINLKRLYTDSDGKQKYAFRREFIPLDPTLNTRLHIFKVQAAIALNPSYTQPPQKLGKAPPRE